MYDRLRFLACSLPLLLVAPCLHAQTIGTLTCTSSSGPALSAPVFSFDAGFSNTTEGSVSSVITEAIFYLPFAEFAPALAATAAQTNYGQCTVTNGEQTISFSNAVFNNAEAFVVGPGLEGNANGQLYTFVDFSYSAITVGGTTITPPPSTLTAEEKAAARTSLRTQSLLRLEGKVSGGN